MSSMSVSVGQSMNAQGISPIPPLVLVPAAPELLLASCVPAPPLLWVAAPLVLAELLALVDMVTFVDGEEDGSARSVSGLTSRRFVYALCCSEIIRRLSDVCLFFQSVILALSLHAAACRSFRVRDEENE